MNHPIFTVMDPKNEWTLCTRKKQKVGKSVRTLQLEPSPNTHFASKKHKSQDLEVKGLARQLKEVEEEDFSTLQLDHPDDHSKLKKHLRLEGLLDSQLEVLIRLVVASATRPPEYMEPLGTKYAKGILLYGPPGTGKTHLIRQIGELLLARELKYVTAPEVLAEGNIRKLFQDAEEEQERLGSKSALHVIAIDYIDAISKARGSIVSAYGTRKTVLNELLSRIDGLDNILVIGTTDRRDLVDETLLRRFGVQIEIGLPNKSHRAQILKTHLAKLVEFNEIASDVDLSELIIRTENFTAADIECLVHAAKTKALSRLIKIYPKVEIDPHFAEKFNVCRSDFFPALDHYVKPALESNAEVFEPYISNGFISWGCPFKSVFANGTKLIQKALSERSGSGLFTVLVEGPHKSGKTAIAAQLAKNFDFPFVRICSLGKMVGLSTKDKCAKIRQDFDESYTSDLSCILIDNIEQMMEYREIGTRYSKIVLQTFLELFNKPPPDGRKLVVICTTSCKQELEKLKILPPFNAVLKVPYLSTVEHLTTVLEVTKVLTDIQITDFAKKIGTRRPKIGIKKWLWINSLAKLIDDDGGFVFGTGKEKFDGVENRVDYLFWELQSDGCLV